MKTKLYNKHCALGAKIIEFSGWEMPVQYTGIIHEHNIVRSNVGIFDVSHMGRILVEGKDAENFLDYLSTNRITEKSDLSATYTVWANKEGGCIDDVIIYRRDSTHFFVIVNAGNRDKDLAHLKIESKNFDVKLTDRYQEDGILAIQGPKAESVVERLYPDVIHLKKMQFLSTLYNGSEIILSRTGYTGQDGFEIYAPLAVIEELWDWFLEKGKEAGIEPIGLGARDTLRLEMGYPLYGHELREDIFPNETVARWTIKWDKDFLGKSAMQKQEDSGKIRHQYGIELLEKGIAREGYEVYKNEQIVGKVTSGTFSPSLNKAIALVLVREPLQIGDLLDIQIRQNRTKAKVIKLPFYGEQNS